METSNTLRRRETPSRDDRSSAAETLLGQAQEADITNERAAPVPANGKNLRQPNFDEAGNVHDVLTIEELARLLRVNRKTLYGMVRDGRIPGVRMVGTAYRASRAAVLRWLAEGQGRVSKARRRR